MQTNLEPQMLLGNAHVIKSTACIRMWVVTQYIADTAAARVIEQPCIDKQQSGCEERL